MFKKITKPLLWFFAVVLIWLIYLTLSILSFPTGSLNDSADVAIVLGAAVSNDKPSPVFAERINHATKLYRQGKVKKLIFTGGVGNQQRFAESSIARVYAISKQVKAEDIFIETESRTTKQNIVNAQQIMQRENLTSALLISDSLHLKRALQMAQDLNLNATASATPSSRYQTLKTKLPFALREVYFYHYYLLFNE